MMMHDLISIELLYANHRRQTPGLFFPPSDVTGPRRLLGDLEINLAYVYGQTAAQNDQKVRLQPLDDDYPKYCCKTW